MNRKVLVSDAYNFDTGCPINPYYQANFDKHKVMTEHKNIVNLLTQAGIEVIQVPSPANCQDGVYTANWALVRGNSAVLAHLPNARQAEVSYAEKVLKSLGKHVIRLPQGLRFSGQGDALPCGNLLFCGSKYRSDIEAQEFAAQTLGFERVQLQTVPQTNNEGREQINSFSGWPDSFFYDIDLALAVIQEPTKDKKGLIAYCPEAFTTDSQTILDAVDIDKIVVSLDEAKSAFATNLVSTGKNVIMSACAPKLAKELQKRGLTVLATPITELSKGGGYIRCVTLTLD
jgi:N-dimethylarginine dimethylaminohydrolase